jgi:hypothetical protein
MTYTILSPFAVPIIKFEFKYHDRYKFNEIEKIERIPVEWAKSINSSFPNIRDDDYLISPNIRDSLINDLKESIQDVFEELNIPKEFYFQEFWYNVYHDGQGQEAHNHLPFAHGRLPYWSGIYYNKNASPTKFIRPDRLYATQLFEGYKESSLSNFYFYSFHPDVNDGDIILFPPYLDHYIDEDEQRKDNMRLTFAFNMIPMVNL